MRALDFWPSPKQELLLAAALREGASAIRAWCEWRETEQFETADSGSQRLGPLVHYNLQRAGFSDPSMLSLRQAYIRTRVANRLMLAKLNELLGLFDSCGVRCLVLKGAALGVAIYGDPGLRPMGDLDVAVPHADAEKATECLKASGWVESHEITGASKRPGDIMEIAYTAEDGTGLDLHFSPFHGFGPFFEDRQSWRSVEPLWTAALPLQIGGAHALTLSPTDHLAHTLAHGAQVNLISPIRWVADAMWLLRGPSSIDWNCFLDRAEALHLGLVFEKTLTYLKANHMAEIPPRVLTRLARSPSRLERREYAFRSGRASDFTRWSHSWTVYRRMFPDRGPAALAAGFPRHLRDGGSRGVWSVALRALRKWPIKR